MLSKLKSFFNRLLGKAPAQAPARTKSTVSIGDKVGNVTISKQYQLDKHTPFKPGESYRVGEMSVTVHATKQSMLDAIAKVDARRKAKEDRLRERAIDIMLMTPEQLMQFKVQAWLEARKRPEAWYSKLFNRNARYTAPIEPQVSGKMQDRFESIMQTVKDKDSVY